MVLSRIFSLGYKQCDGIDWDSVIFISYVVSSIILTQCLEQMWFQINVDFPWIYKDSQRFQNYTKLPCLFVVCLDKKKLVLNIYILSDKSSQYLITYYFCFLERQSSIQLSFLYFSSISKGKNSLKCNNIIIKIRCFCLSSIVLGFTLLTTKISNLRNMHIVIHQLPVNDDKI